MQRENCNTVIQDAGTAFNKLRPYPSFQRGLESGGSLLVQSAMVLGRYGGPVSTASLSPESESDSAVDQEGLLTDWAQAHNCWFTNANSHLTAQGYRFYGFGGEAQVYAEKDEYVHKVCRIGQYESPGRFFDRIIIENTLCPAAALVVEGFGRNADDEFVILMRQRFFRQAYIMNEKEISLYMKCLGFRKNTDDRYGVISYLSDLVIAEDLHPGNIWMTEDDNIVIIDGAFFFNFPSLGLGGSFEL